MHPLFEEYLKDHWPGGANEVETKQDMEIFKECLDDHTYCMSVHWASIRRAGKSLGYDFDLGDACHYAYAVGWEYNGDTRKLKQLFQQIVYPKPLDKKLEDYL